MLFSIQPVGYVQTVAPSSSLPLVVSGYFDLRVRRFHGWHLSKYSTDQKLSRAWRGYCRRAFPSRCFGLRAPHPGPPPKERGETDWSLSRADLGEQRRLDRQAGAEGQRDAGERGP